MKEVMAGPGVDLSVDRLLSDGEATGAGRLHPIMNPSTGAELGRIPLDDPLTVAGVCDSMSAAQSDWCQAPYIERAGVLRRLGQILEQGRDDIQQLLAIETGSASAKARIEIAGSIQECFQASALAGHPHGEVLRSRTDRQSYSLRIPVGVVGVITPFNFPLYLGLRAVAPALALGNVVVLKADPRTPLSGGRLIQRALEAAGLPDGVLRIVNGAADVGSALIASPDVDMVAFTGSTDVGRRIARDCGAQLKRVHLELGGNSAAVVTPTADVESAARAGSWGSFGHQGQVCMSTGRHIVHERVADSYADAMAAIASSLQVGDASDPSSDLGPIIDRSQLERVDSFVRESRQQGSQLLAGGTFSDLFYDATVLRVEDVDDPCFSNEVFGPVAPIITYRSTEDAIALANRGTSGLAVSVLTGDQSEGVAIAERIQSGIAHVNDHTLNDEPVAPFSGWKHSGWGGSAYGGQGNLEAFTSVRWLTSRSSIPPSPFALSRAVNETTR